MSWPIKLRMELIVQFDATGEVGADSGALRREFFEDAICQANLLLLEGEDERRVLKKTGDWNSSPKFLGCLLPIRSLKKGQESLV